MATVRTKIRSVPIVWIGIAATILCIGVAIIYLVLPIERKVDLYQPTLNQKEPAQQSLDDQHLSTPTNVSTSPTTHPDRKLRYAWQRTPVTALNEIERPENLPDESVHITLPGDYGQWLLGTPVEVEIPQTSKKFRSVVDRIVPDEFGNTKIFTKPSPDEEEFHRLIVTYTDTHTIAYVSTALGSYELTAGESGGWLIPTSSLNKRRDFSLKDTGESLRFRHTKTRYVPPRDE